MYIYPYKLLRVLEKKKRKYLFAKLSNYHNLYESECASLLIFCLQFEYYFIKIMEAIIPFYHMYFSRKTGSLIFRRYNAFPFLTFPK